MSGIVKFFEPGLGMLCREVKRGRRFMGRLDFGADLLEGINAVCKENDIRLGEVKAIGAVQKAKVGYYDQGEKKYRTIEFNEPLEIVSLLGNISLKDGQPFVHAHIALMRKDGSMLGGHLVEGCKIWALEYIINEVITDDEKFFERKHDKNTALYLWA